MGAKNLSGPGTELLPTLGADPVTPQGRMTCGVKTMDAPVDPGSLASTDGCRSSLIQRMDSGQWFLLEADG